MREIQASRITGAIAEMCQQANFELGEDVLDALRRAEAVEESPQGKEVLSQLLENARIARAARIPLCQDCGTAVVFLEIGQEVHIAGDLAQAVNEGVRQGYAQGYLRRCIVRQPFSRRANTQDNTPAVIHAEIVPGDKLRIYLMTKGAGAENMSRLAMLKPAEGRQGIIDFVVRAVDEAGGNPCPPLVVGVGIGGTAEQTMLMAKKALLRPVGKASPDAETAALEQDILKRVNSLGIGPMGFGGRVTALAVHIEAMPAHIGSLPAAVNLQCHCDRHKEAVL